MATIEILFHEYERVERSFVTVLPDESIPNKVTYEAKETVAMHFKIVDGEPVPKRGGLTMKPLELHVAYSSINGAPWRESTTPMITGMNIKKDGSDGAHAETRSYNFPAWARDLVRGASPVHKWIEETYPR